MRDQAVGIDLSEQCSRRRSSGVVIKNLEVEEVEAVVSTADGRRRRFCFLPSSGGYLLRRLLSTTAVTLRVSSDMNIPPGLSQENQSATTPKLSIIRVCAHSENCFLGHDVFPFLMTHRSDKSYQSDPSYMTYEPKCDL